MHNTILDWYFYLTITFPIFGSMCSLAYHLSSVTGHLTSIHTDNVKVQYTLRVVHYLRQCVQNKRKMTLTLVSAQNEFQVYAYTFFFPAVVSSSHFKSSSVHRSTRIKDVSTVSHPQCQTSDWPGTDRQTMSYCWHSGGQDRSTPDYHPFWRDGSTRLPSWPACSGCPSRSP